MLSVYYFRKKQQESKPTRESSTRQLASVRFPLWPLSPSIGMRRDPLPPSELKFPLRSRSPFFPMASWLEIVEGTLVDPISFFQSWWVPWFVFLASSSVSRIGLMDFSPISYNFGCKKLGFNFSLDKFLKVVINKVRDD